MIFLVLPVATVSDDGHFEHADGQFEHSFSCAAAMLQAKATAKQRLKVFTKFISFLRIDKSEFLFD